MILTEINPEFIPGARIKVIGVWWAWVNAVNRMIGDGIEWVEFIAVNTDAQQLANSLCDRKINIGLNLTKWLGAGANPDVGRKAAEEDAENIKALLKDADMVFISAGMGGGTGTWAASVIASIAKEMWVLTVAVVTKPFSFEGKQRFVNAAEGLEKLKNNVDTLIIIPNDKIFNVVDKKTTFKQAFSMIDKILTLGVQGITDLIIKPGLINIDFADIKRIMLDSGTAVLGIWYGEWENRAVEAARRAIDNPLLDAHLDGAKNIIFAVTGGEDLTPVEVQDAARIVEEIADPDANIIWGMTYDESYQWEVKVTIIATGFSDANQDTMLKAGSLRDVSGGRRTKGTATPTWTRSQDFVSRSMANSNVQQASQPTRIEEPTKPQVDFETPPFLRKRLGQ